MVTVETSKTTVSEQTSSLNNNAIMLLGTLSDQVADAVRNLENINLGDKGADIAGLLFSALNSLAEMGCAQMANPSHGPR